MLDVGAHGEGTGLGPGRPGGGRALSGNGGVVVSLGGDIAVAGQSPTGGWPLSLSSQAVMGVEEESHEQTVRLAAGGVATSSTGVRRWRRGARTMHHIVDPRSGRPATGPWHTATVAASSCTQANAASTAALVAGDGAEEWLRSTGLPARLVGTNGTVRSLGGWPADDFGEIPLAIRAPTTPEVGSLPSGGSRDRHDRRHDRRPLPWMWLVSRGTGLVLSRPVHGRLRARRDGPGAQRPPSWSWLGPQSFRHGRGPPDAGAVLRGPARPARGHRRPRPLRVHRMVGDRRPVHLALPPPGAGSRHHGRRPRVAVVVTSVLRRRLGYRLWRGVHWLAYLSWPVAFLHSISAGGDMGIWWVAALVWGCATAVALAVATRVHATWQVGAPRDTTDPVGSGEHDPSDVRMPCSNADPNDWRHDATVVARSTPSPIDQTLRTSSRLLPGRGMQRGPRDPPHGSRLAARVRPDRWLARRFLGRNRVVRAHRPGWRSLPDGTQDRRRSERAAVGRSSSATAPRVNRPA